MKIEHVHLPQHTIQIEVLSDKAPSGTPSLFSLNAYARNPHAASEHRRELPQRRRLPVAVT